MPPNLTGKTFQAVLAARQSLLESVLLRRKIMGPSWIAVRRPYYVPSDQQVIPWGSNLAFQSPLLEELVCCGSECGLS